MPSWWPRKAPRSACEAAGPRERSPARGGQAEVSGRQAPGWAAGKAGLARGAPRPSRGAQARSPGGAPRNVARLRWARRPGPPGQGASAAGTGTKRSRPEARTGRAGGGEGPKGRPQRPTPAPLASGRSPSAVVPKPGRLEGGLTGLSRDSEEPQPGDRLRIPAQGLRVRRRRWAGSATGT